MCPRTESMTESMREAGRLAGRLGLLNTVIHWSPTTESRSWSRSCLLQILLSECCVYQPAPASRKTVFCVWAPLTLASANIESLKWYTNAYRNNLYYSYLYLWSNGPNSWHPSPHDKSSRRRVRWRNFLIQMVTFIVLYILTLL